ncbi:MAG: hypothetical protein WCY41_05585 [Candidatus Micrarchaeia archaeon]
MENEKLLSKERHLSDAALALDKQMAELKNEREMRFERVGSDMKWLKTECEQRMEGMRNSRSRILLDLYRLREMLSQARATKKAR